MVKHIKFFYLCVLVLFQLFQAEALVISTTAASNSLAIPTPVSLTTAPTSIGISTTLSTTSSYSYSTIYLHLPLSTNAPDSIGFSQVSGFYGPGAWAGWFITTVASWYHMIREAEGSIDINTWLYLLGTNWAAFDFIRYVFKARDLGGHSTIEGMKQMAQIGAAFSVLWWGVLHALLQLLALVCIAEATTRKVTQGIVTVATGLFLPLFGLALALFTVTGYSIPALYWDGIASIDQELDVIWVSLLGLWAPLCAIGLLLKWSFDKPLPSWISKRIHLPSWPQVRLPGIFQSIYDVVPIIFIVLFALLVFTGVLLVMCFAFLIPIMVSLALIPSAFKYLNGAYTPWGKIKISQSCYFMPCAPQSLSESDQAFALLAGLFTFLGIEVMPGLLNKTKEAWKNRRQFEEELRRRFGIEMARRTNSGLENQRPD